MIEKKITLTPEYKVESSKNKVLRREQSLSFVKTRNIENYLDKIKLKAKGTVRNIKNYLGRFDKYLQEIYDKSNNEILDEILSLPETQRYPSLFDIIQDYVNSLSSKTNHLHAGQVSAGYIRHNIHAIKGYLRLYGFQITSDDIKDNVTLPKVIEEERESLTREQLQIFIKNQSGLRKVLYMVMSSTGLRPSEALRIRKCDLDLDSYERIMIKVSGKITKTRKPRITFITKETENELLPFLKKLENDDLVFNQTGKTMEQVRLNEEQVFGRLREKLGFTEKYESGIYKISLGDSLRSWFITKCNRIDYGFGYALAGHDQYMKRYDRLTKEDKVELFLKTEKLLQVFEYTSEDQDQTIKLLSNKVKELETNNEKYTAKLVSLAMKKEHEKFTELIREKVKFELTKDKEFEKIRKKDEEKMRKKNDQI